MVPKNLKGDRVSFKGLDEDRFDSGSSEILVPSMVLKRNKFFADFIADMADLSASPVENKRINIENLRRFEELSENSANISITDISSDAPRMLGRKITPKTKKSREYYKNNMNGVRKVVVPNFSEEFVNFSEDNNSQKSSRTNTVSEGSSAASNYEAEIDRLKGELRKKFDADSEDDDSDDASDRELGDIGNTINEERAHFLGTLERMKTKKGKKRGKKSKRGKKGKHSESSVSLSSSASSAKSSKSSKKMSNADQNIYSKYINSETQRAIDALPEGYVGEVPDHIRAKLPVDAGFGGEAPSVVGDVPPMGNVPPEGAMGMGAMPGMPMGGMPMGGMPMGGMPMGAMPGMPMGAPGMNMADQSIGLDTVGSEQMGHAVPEMPMGGMPMGAMPGMPMGGMPMGGMPMGVPGMPMGGMPMGGMPMGGVPAMSGGGNRFKLVKGSESGAKSAEQQQNRNNFFF
jgi:hypothetical protein